jgi:hypothetical protein
MADRFVELDIDFHKSNMRIDPMTKHKIFDHGLEIPPSFEKLQKDLIKRVLELNMPP